MRCLSHSICQPLSVLPAYTAFFDNDTCVLPIDSAQQVYSGEPCLDAQAGPVRGISQPPKQNMSIASSHRHVRAARTTPGKLSSCMAVVTKLQPKSPSQPWQPQQLHGAHNLQSLCSQHSVCKLCYSSTAGTLLQCSTRPADSGVPVGVIASREGRHRGGSDHRCAGDERGGCRLIGNLLSDVLCRSRCGCRGHNCLILHVGEHRLGHSACNLEGQEVVLLDRHLRRAAQCTGMRASR